MTSPNPQSFTSEPRRSQSLRNDRCQNILYKAVFEHFTELDSIAALLLTSKSFQNSSFGANFIVNFVVEENSILLLDSVLSPSSCFSLQFVPSLYVKQSWMHSGKIMHRFSNFAREIVNTKYIHLSLRSLTLETVPHEVFSFFFSEPWPQLQDLTLKNCELNDAGVETISKQAIQLHTLRLSKNDSITDVGLEKISTLSNITALDLRGCARITDAGLAFVAKLSGLASLDLSNCNKITDIGLDHLSRLPRIKSLNLTWCSKITDAGLELLSKLERITSLDLSNGKVTDAGLEHVSELSNLTSLGLAWCHFITDSGIERVSKRSGITSLCLTGCIQITDDSVEHLSNLSGITFLDVRYCRNISPEAATKFTALLPNSVISCS